MPRASPWQAPSILDYWFFVPREIIAKLQNGLLRGSSLFIPESPILAIVLSLGVWASVVSLMAVPFVVHAIPAIIQSERDLFVQSGLIEDAGFGKVLLVIASYLPRRSRPGRQRWSTTQTSRSSSQSGTRAALPIDRPLDDSGLRHGTRRTALVLGHSATHTSNANQVWVFRAMQWSIFLSDHHAERPTFWERWRATKWG